MTTSLPRDEKTSPWIHQVKSLTDPKHHDLRLYLAQLGGVTNYTQRASRRVTLGEPLPGSMILKDYFHQLLESSREGITNNTLRDTHELCQSHWQQLSDSKPQPSLDFY